MKIRKQFQERRKFVPNGHILTSNLHTNERARVSADLYARWKSKGGSQGGIPVAEERQSPILYLLEAAKLL